MITHILIAIHALLTFMTIEYGKGYIFRPFDFDIVHNEECRIAFLSALGTFVIWGALL